MAGDERQAELWRIDAIREAAEKRGRQSIISRLQEPDEALVQAVAISSDARDACIRIAATLSDTRRDTTPKEKP